MSSLQKLKKQIHTTRVQQGGFNAFRDYHTSDGRQSVILPKKPKQKQKLLGVEEEADQSIYRSQKSCPKKAREEEILDGEDEADTDDEEEKEKKSKKKKKTKQIPWGPKELLENLDNKDIVCDLEGVVLPSLLDPSLMNPSSSYRKKKDGKGDNEERIVWDNGQTPQGEKSDNNFFLWLEAYSACRCKEKKEEENAAFT